MNTLNQNLSGKTIQEIRTRADRDGFYRDFLMILSDGTEIMIGGSGIEPNDYLCCSEILSGGVL